MRALVDTNVLISAILSPTSSKPPTSILQHAVAGTFTLVISETTMAELKGKIKSKPYLTARLPDGIVDPFIQLLQSIATILPELAEEFPALSRDRKDDYLLFHAVTESADFLVSGDKDLLVLQQIDSTRIVSPAAFVAILKAEAAS